MTERRAAPRYPLSLSILVRVPAFGPVCRYVGQTREISTRGVYFVLGRNFDPGDVIDVTITLPLDGQMSFLVHASARVAWVHRRSENDFGIGAAIERYEIFRDRDNVIEFRSKTFV